MTQRTATCRCGKLRAECAGEPIRISVYHCFECQKRSGSAFAIQARRPDENVTLSGVSNTWERTAESGHRAAYRFCPTCGSTLAYVIEGWRGVTAFAAPDFPPPKLSVYEHRQHAWAVIGGDTVGHSAIPGLAHADKPPPQTKV